VPPCREAVTGSLEQDNPSLCRGIYFKSDFMYTHCMTTKYTIKRAYRVDSSTGRERVVWWIMHGEVVVDACDLKRDAQYFCDKWNGKPL